MSASRLSKEGFTGTIRSRHGDRSGIAARSRGGRAAGVPTTEAPMPCPKCQGTGFVSTGGLDAGPRYAERCDGEAHRRQGTGDRGQGEQKEIQHGTWWECQECGQILDRPRCSNCRNAPQPPELLCFDCHAAPATVRELAHGDNARAWYRCASCQENREQGTGNRGQGRDKEKTL